MPEKLDNIYESVKRKLSGKVNPRTKKKYTDSDIWAIARAQYEKTKKNFSVFSPITKSWEKEGKSITKGEKTFMKGKQRFVEATVTGLEEDRDGEKMSQEAIDDMVKQFKSGKIPFFPDHGRDEQTGTPGIYSWKQMMGVWIDARQEGKEVKAVVRLNNTHPDADLFWGYIQEGMPIGMSIGGKSLGPPEEIEVDEE